MDSSKFLSQRGFNMFSAIVSVVLIMIVSVLVGTLVMSEEKTSTQIYGMLNNYHLADAANIARADALQSFNYSFRQKMEDYLTVNESNIKTYQMELFQLRDDGEDITFDELKQKFEENILRNSDSGSSDANSYKAVIYYVAQNTVQNFSSWTYGKYKVDIDDKETASQENLFNALSIALNRQGGNFLEIVDCTETSCPKGSFYFNIPLNLLTDEEYEKIPKIIVQDTFTQEQIKMGILPKTNIKVYVPLRFFKVLYEARDAAKGIRNAHAANAMYRLGFCDGVCTPRTSATDASSTPDWDRDCPTSEESKWIVMLTAKHAGIDSYFAGGSYVGSAGLRGYGAEEVCAQSQAANAFETDSPDGTFFVKNTFLDPYIATQIKEVIPGCGYYDVIIGASPEISGEIRGGASEKLYCARITEVTADIVFVDTNPNFMVRGTSMTAGVKSNMYKIRVHDIGFIPAISDATPTFYCNTGLGKCTLTS